MRNVIDRKFGILKKLLAINSIMSIVLTFMLILPNSYEKYFDLLNKISEYFCLGGSKFIAPTNGVYILLINTVGIDMILIAAFVLYAEQDITNRKPIVISYMIARSLLFVMNLYYYFDFNTPKIIMIFSFLDFIFIVLEIYYFFKIRNTMENNT